MAATFTHRGAGGGLGWERGSSVIERRVYEPRVGYSSASSTVVSSRLILECR